MARISTYAIDGTPVSSDKLIGTDTAGTVTKNYPLGDVADWLKSSGATAVLGQNNYLFQTALDPDEGRKIGSFSFENYGGDGTEFSAVTELKFSASSSTGQYVADYLLSTVGQKVLISQLDAPNNFGIYALVSLTQSSLEPTFYDAVLAFVDGNGALQGNESYGLATYSALNEAGGGTWGSITGTITNQTDLVDYIDAEIAAIPAPATPTLQSVTDAGAITTNDITTGSVTSNGNFLITGNDSTVQLRGSSVDFNIQTAAADNVARIATTTGGSARLDLYNHISGFNGALEFRATSWENDALVISGGSPNATKFLVSRDPNAATLQVTGDSYFTGNVGIGTTSPTEKLELSSSGTTKIKIGSTNSFGRGIELYTTGAATFLDVEGNFSIRKYNDDPLWTAQAGTVIANQYFYGGYINFRQRGGATDLAQIGLENGSNTYFNTGNFGIGTTAPAHVLHINKDNPYIQIQDSSAPTRADMSAGIIMKDSTGAQSFGITQSNSVDVSIRANAGDLSLGTFAGTVIKLDGNNVGIGTTAPSEKLEVNGNVKASKVLVNTTNAGYTFYSNGESRINNITFQSVGNDDYLQKSASDGRFWIRNGRPGQSVLLGANDTNGQLNDYLLIDGNTQELRIKTASSDRLVVNSNGNVGIGATAPTEKLHVDGNALIENNLHVRGELTIGKIVNDTELVDIGGNINYDTVGEPGATDTADFVATILNEPGNIDNGSHTYTVIYKTADGGETGTYNAPYFKTITIVDNATAGQVELTGIPVSTDARVVARDIYRSEANGSPYYGKKLATINDNTTTTYVDNLPDSALDQDTLFYRKANTTAGVNFIDGVIISQAPSPHRTSYGFGALQNVTIGQDNVAIGGQSLTSITSGKQNTAVGYATGTNSIDGENNTFIGYSNGYYNDSGDWNTYVGSFAGRNANNTTTNYNTGIGGGALNGLTLNNSWNTALGYEAGKSFQGAWNIHIGYQSGRKSTGTPTGNFNINLGTYSGRATTGSNNVVVGYGIEVPAPSGSNQLNIGNLIYATGLSTLTTASTGKVGIGTAAPDSKLHIKATSGIAFKVDPNNADKEWYIDTTNPDHLKKEGNLILNADPTNVHTSTKISFNIDGSNKASINSDGDIGVGTTAQTSKVHVDGTAMRQLRIGTAGGPSSNTDTSGAEGDIAYDDLYLYIKTGSGWGRVALDFAF